MFFLQQIWENFLDILYPSPEVCLLCRQNPVAKNQICRKCARELEIWQTSSASRNTVYVGKRGKFLSNFYLLYAAAPYKGAFKQAIQNLKYGKKTYLASVLGEIMALYLQTKAKLVFDLIIPVPLTSRKETQRGFNQAQLLAEVISLKLNIPLEKGLLVKQRETKTQVSLKKDKRLQNLKGAFTLSHKISERPRILLIDDIFTTGATAKEAVLTLLKGGADEVTVLVWAKSIAKY